MIFDQTEVPILEAIDEFIREEQGYFCIPGHRSNKGIPEELEDRFGGNMFRYDLTETDGLDDLHDPRAAIKRALLLAADAFGASRSWFSINGTTAANEAMIMAAAREGEKVIIARNAHKSSLSGLVLSGASPIWIECERDPEFGFGAEIRPETVRAALEEDPDAKAVMIVSPTYYGKVSDIRAIADVCHEYHAALLVDEAHGTHLRFSDRLPKSALESGADLVSMSIHKTAGALGQSSMLHYVKNHGVFLDEDRIDASLKIVMSTSPSYVLMSSLDAARKELAVNGTKICDAGIDTAMYLRRELSKIPGIRVYGGTDERELLKNNIDASRVVFSADDLRGIELKNMLWEEGRISLEMADSRNLTAVVTGANELAEADRLARTVKSILSKRTGEPRSFTSLKAPGIPKAVMTPREAFFKKSIKLELDKAEGYIAAEGLSPYPPGVPVVNPGEKINAETVSYLIKCMDNGVPVHGISEDGKVRVLEKDN